MDTNTSHWKHGANRPWLMSALRLGSMMLGFCAVMYPQIRVERRARAPIRLGEIYAGVAVPNLAARNLADGEAQLNALNLKLGKVGEVVKDASSIDLILAQSPAPGARVPAGSNIDLQVGVADVLVPRLRGLSLGDAEKALRDAHLDVGQISTVERSGGTPGMVLRANPADGATVRSHRKVALLVVAGTVDVPDLTGRNVVGAQALLAASNLALGSITGRPFRVDGAQSAAVPQVVSDWSSKGQSVPVGTAINISFPGGNTFLDERVAGSLAASQMAQAIKIPRTYPTKEDRLTSLELLSMLLERKPGTVMQLMVLRHLDPIFPAGIKVIEGFEGWEPNLYNDAAHYCTIGYGHLVKRLPCDGSESDEFQRGLSEPRGVDILQGDLHTAHSAVADLVKIKLTDGQVAALTDFVFNVGSGNFRTSTLLKVVNAGDLDHVRPQFRRWVRAGGKVWPGLVKRRDGEINLFFAGMSSIRAYRLPPRPEPEPPQVDIQVGEGR